MKRPRDIGAGNAQTVSPAIEFDKVSKSFTSAGTQGRVTAVQDISFTVEPSEFVALLGPSGCGKTTILRMADGLIESDVGRVAVFGAPPKPGPEIGVVFQNFRLIPWATVQANVEFGMKSIALTASERLERVHHHLELVGLSKFRNAYPRELSGGMKQRTALARALATAPDILLMDEPFASIDAQTRELMQVELMRIWTDRRPVVLLSRIASTRRLFWQTASCCCAQDRGKSLRRSTSHLSAHAGPMMSVQNLNSSSCGAICRSVCASLCFRTRPQSFWARSRGILTSITGVIIGMALQA